MARFEYDPRNFDPAREAVNDPLVTEKETAIPYALMFPNRSEPRILGGRILHVFLAEGSVLSPNKRGTHSVAGATYFASSELYERGWSAAVLYRAAQQANGGSADMYEVALREILSVPDVDLRHISVGLEPDNMTHYHLFGLRSSYFPPDELLEI